MIDLSLDEGEGCKAGWPLYASPSSPLRMSKLTGIMACPASVKFEDNESSQAAETGSAVGRMIELYHLGADIDEGVLRANFPLADLDRAGKLLDAYTLDPRNPKDAVVRESLEETVTAILEPHPLDRTGLPVVLIGHLDQVRVSDAGFYEIWDVKSGRKDRQLPRYAFQLHAYCEGYAQKYPDRKVRVGGIINLVGYEQTRMEGGERNAATGRMRGAKKTEYAIGEHPVFLRSLARRSTHDLVLLEIRRTIALIRMGQNAAVPGEWCSYCPGDEFPVCLEV